MDATERRAFLTLLILAVTGQVILTALREPHQPPGAVSLLPPEPRSSLESHRDQVAQLARPLAEGEKVDLDRAGLHEMTRLPRIGVGLAGRIVADRTRNGPFGSLEGLGRVAGIGPATLAALQPHVVFGDMASGGVSGRSAGSRPGLPKVFNINTLSARELQGLPGIGPQRAQAIVAYRESHGPFASVGELGSVPGIGEGVLARISTLVTVK